MLLLALSMVETAEEAAKLTRLYELYSTEMYHAAKNILRNHHDAEDAMQNAFVQLIRLLDHIKDPESPSTRAYVISAVQSRATDLYRYIPLQTAAPRCVSGRVGGAVRSAGPARCAWHERH